MDTRPTALATPSLGLSTSLPGPTGVAVPTGRPARAAWVRAVLLARRRPAEAATSAGFYLLVAGLWSLTTAPLGLPAVPTAATAAWIAALLAALLAQQQALRADAAAGVLDQLRLAPGGMQGPVAALLAAQVAATSLPLLVATPFVALFFGLTAAETGALGLSLLVGLPSVCVLAAFASALTLASRATPAALGLLTLPLAVPVLLFGVRAAQPGTGPSALLLVLACTIAAGALGPFAVAAALSLEDEA